MSLTRATEPPVSIDEPPPSYNAAATCTCTEKPFKQVHVHTVRVTLPGCHYDTVIIVLVPYL